MDAGFSDFVKTNYLSDAEPRYRGLAEDWRANAKLSGWSFARAPGRINLIGEHTDYNGCPAFPMPIDRDFIAVFAAREEPVLEVSDRSRKGYGSRRFALEREIPPYPSGDWGNYLKAAAQGIMAYLEERGELTGAKVYFSGNIPPSAGLSSSSALVVLTAVILLSVNQREIPSLELASLLAEAERYVGTQGGGMDQAACLMGRSGSALKMDFFPLAVTPAAVPEDLIFVVAHSMVTADKTGAAMDRYNRRSMECRLITALLDREFRIRSGSSSPIRFIGDLKPEVLPFSEEKIREIADSAIPYPSYSLKQIAAILGLPAEEVAGRFCRRKDGSILPEPEDGFKLGMRYRHVVSEWERVEKAMDALTRGDGRRLGRLMDESHASCRDLYEISCPELERLTETARRHGALGSRLTGAGFGGCTISLVPQASVSDFLEKLSRDYYLPLGMEGGSALGDVLFPCRAVDGAGVLPWRLP